MAYTIYRTNGSLLTNIADNTLNTTSTPLSLPGRNYASYGQVVDTNFVHQLENFANVTPPDYAIKGQLWYNTAAETLYVCPTDGETDPNNWYPILTLNNISNLVVDNLTANANVTANNASITNDLDANTISTNYLTVNVSANINTTNLTGITTANSITTNNITTGSNTTAGTLTGNWSLNGALSSNGNVSALGVKTDNYYYANGNPVSFDGTYTNSNVAAYLPTYSGNVGGVGNVTIFNGGTLSAGSNTAVGTITGNWNLSTGSKITGLSDINGANVIGTVANATFAENANIANTVRTNAQPNITSVGTLTSLTVSGNVSASGLTATGNVTFSGSNVTLGSNANVRITGGSFGYVLATDGSGGLSWVPTGTAITAQTVTNNAQPNINSVGVLDSLVVTGNITAGNVYANAGRIGASLLTGTLTTAAQPNVTSLGTLANLEVSGNATFTGPVVNVGSAANLRIAGGTAGEVLTSAGSGQVVWQTITAPAVFPTGTKMLFAQTTAPLGWTKQTTTDNAALRVVSGTAGSGGSVNFTAAFTNQAVTGGIGSTSAGGSVGSTSISADIANTTVAGNIGTTSTGGTVESAGISASIGSTSVTGSIGETAVSGSTNTQTTGIYLGFLRTGVENEKPLATPLDQVFLNDPGHAHNFTSNLHNHTFSSPNHTHTFSQSAHTHGFTGSSHSHTFASSPHSHTFSQSPHSHSFSGSSHSHTFSGTAINLAVKYVDVIIAEKD